MSEKNRRNKFFKPAFACLALAVCVSYIVMTDGVQKDEANADNSDLGNTESFHKTTYKFTGGEDKMYMKEISVDDNWFLQDEYKYNHDLAKASLAMSLSAFTPGDAIAYWGENGNYNREIHIKQVLSDTGFKKCEFYGYDVNLNDSSSKVAFAIGHKSVKEGDGLSDVVCVAIRGGGYGCEWADNFKLGEGESPFHQGFLKSAENVKEKLDDYINRRCNNKKVKLWITGYSRGGAVANVLASFYDSEKKSNGYGMYAYTFAAPSTVDTTALGIEYNKFANIFNIINPYDIVPVIPPSDWGFSRAGISLYFPLYNEENTELFNGVSSRYTELTGVAKELFEPSPLKSVTDIVVKLSKDRRTYATVFQPILEDLVLSSMTREKIDGKWTVIPFKKYIEQKYGSDTAMKIQRVEENVGLPSVGDIKPVLPADFMKFLVLCELNGVGDISSVISESLTLRSAHEIAGLSGESIFSGSVSGHFPEVYLAWMEIMGENDFELKH